MHSEFIGQDDLRIRSFFESEAISHVKLPCRSQAIVYRVLSDPPHIAMMLPKRTDTTTVSPIHASQEAITHLGLSKLGDIPSISAGVAPSS